MPKTSPSKYQPTKAPTASHRTNGSNEPKQEEVNLEDPEISLKVNELVNKIDNMMSSKASDESFTKLKEKFRTMRVCWPKEGRRIFS
jgi:hypothetical protein